MDKINKSIINKMDASKNNNTQQNDLINENKYTINIIDYLCTKIQNQISKQDDINNLIDCIIYS